MSCEVVTTRGGARAILDHATGEVMHPIVGPLVEVHTTYLVPSRLEARLREPGDDLVLFDVGLGAGSVAVAAWQLSEGLAPGSRRLRIVSFDRDRAALELALSNPGDFGFEGAAGDAARGILSSGLHETARTTWRFVEAELPAAFEGAGEADLVYWDAFSPKRNVELWNVAAFTAVRRCCRPGSLLYTYSGATAVRSALLLAGFVVGVGVPVGAGKFGTTAAVPPSTVDQPLDGRWFERLARSSAPFPADAPTNALELVAALPQLAQRHGIP
ncbi:MAG: MnmC family methyltransferase [Polyangia bacterium]